jgi:hypothetical protein
MPDNDRRRTIVIALAVIIIIVIILLLIRCPGKAPSVPVRDAGTTPTPSPSGPAAPVAAAVEPEEVLTAAVLTVSPQVPAGSAFSLAWTGPNNRGDYVIIVPISAPTDAHGNHIETKHGTPLELTAPINPGPHEVRYVTGRSHTILGRAPIEVLPIAATLDAPAEVPLGAPFSLTWSGPNNKGDYITIVTKDAPDERFESYTETVKGSPLSLTAPPTAGDAELRYVTGQDRKVLARRPIKVAAADITMAAPESAVAGTTIEVTWTGPNNKDDYITIVPAELPEGRYGNYTNTSKGSPLSLLTPIMAGSAELRYMTGQGAKVLGRRPIRIAAADITIAASPEAAVGSAIRITWTGPDNPGDYITVVAKTIPDGQYGLYTLTTKGSPLSVNAPKEVGDAEIRYMTGQGNKVLARIPIRVVP